MMAFFLVMWIMGLSPEDRNEVQGYFNDPMGFMQSSPKGQPNIGPTGGRTSPRDQVTQGNAVKAQEEERTELKTIEKEVEAAMTQGAASGDLASLIRNIELNVSPEGLEIEFVEGKGVVFFELGSSVVRPQASALILRVASAIAESGRMMFIDGHTDGRPYLGGSSDNKLLSAQRAQAVYRLLRQGGVPEKQVLDIRGRGDRKLKYPNDPLDGRNRRVSILLPFKGAEEKLSGDVSSEGMGDGQAKFKSPIEIAPERPDILEKPEKKD